VKRRHLAYVAAVAVSAGLVWLAGWAMAPEAVDAVTAGVALGALFQLLLFGIMVAVFPGRPLPAFGVGMLGRMVLVVAAALAFQPATGLAAAPFLFSLVTVLFTTTLLEPVLMASGAENQAR
jgi:hypothetical protein